MKKPQTKTLNFTIDPFTGASAAVVAMSPAGYRLVSMTRKGTKGKAVYEKIAKGSK